MRETCGESELWSGEIIEERRRRPEVTSLDGSVLFVLHVAVGGQKESVQKRRIGKESKEDRREDSSSAVQRSARVLARVFLMLRRVETTKSSFPLLPHPQMNSNSSHKQKLSTRKRPRFSSPTSSAEA